MKRVLNLSAPEDAIWISCPECDVLPGDSCVFDAEFIEKYAKTPGYQKAVHYARIRALAEIVRDEI